MGWGEGHIFSLQNQTVITHHAWIPSFLVPNFHCPVWGLKWILAGPLYHYCLILPTACSNVTLPRALNYFENISWFHTEFIALPHSTLTCTYREPPCLVNCIKNLYRLYILWIQYYYLPQFRVFIETMN